jgi:hypothetical protein
MVVWEETFLRLMEAIGIQTRILFRLNRKNRLPNQQAINVHLIDETSLLHRTKTRNENDLGQDVSFIG